MPFWPSSAQEKSGGGEEGQCCGFGDRVDCGEGQTIGDCEGIKSRDVGLGDDGIRAAVALAEVARQRAEVAAVHG